MIVWMTAGRLRIMIKWKEVLTGTCKDITGLETVSALLDSLISKNQNNSNGQPHLICNFVDASGHQEDAGYQEEKHCI